MLGLLGSSLGAVTMTLGVSRIVFRLGSTKKRRIAIHLCLLGIPGSRACETDSLWAFGVAYSPQRK